VEPAAERIAGLRGELGLEEGLVLKHLESSNFARLVVRTIENNRRSIGAILRR